MHGILHCIHVDYCFIPISNLHPESQPMLPALVSGIFSHWIWRPSLCWNPLFHQVNAQDTIIYSLRLGLHQCLDAAVTRWIAPHSYSPNPSKPYPTTVVHFPQTRFDSRTSWSTRTVSFHDPQIPTRYRTANCETFHLVLAQGAPAVAL